MAGPCDPGRGLTPRHWSAAGGHLKVVELLVHHVSPWLTRTCLGKTPADLAAEKVHTRVVEYLRWVSIHL